MGLLIIAAHICEEAKSCLVEVCVGIIPPHQRKIEPICLRIEYLLYYYKNINDEDKAHTIESYFIATSFQSFATKGEGILGISSMIGKCI